MVAGAAEPRGRILSYDDVPDAPVAFDKYRRAVVVFVNGERHEVSDVDPTTTLLEWLRLMGLTGTKLGCGEGGCGACTVMLSTFNVATGSVHHAAVNACLMPFCAADWCAVTTVEGIGSTRSGLHPVQERLAQMHGSQCGFCTPGIVMSIYTQLRNRPSLTMGEMQEHLDGNLCRCTGYRPILDAANSLCSDACSGGCVDVSDTAAAACCGSGCAERSACAQTEGGIPELADPTGRLEGGDVVTSSSDKLSHYRERYESTAAAANEPAFPEELAAQAARPLYVSVAGAAWWKPDTLAELLALKQAYPQARLVVGNSEVGIESRYKNHPCRIFLCATAPELHVVEDSPQAMKFGACAPLSEVEHLCSTAAASRPGREGEVARAIKSMLRWFASTQIRNVASLGGNIVTASPISDMIPMLTACGATMTIASAARGSRVAALRDFFLGYRKVDLAPDEIIVCIHVPHSHACDFVRPFKQARRREDDISIVTAGLRVRLSDEGDVWTVADATLAFGGLAPTVVTAATTAAFLTGKEWCSATIEQACTALLEELRVSSSAPGGQPEYRGALASSALFRFFVATSIDLERTADANSPAAPVIAAAERSAGRSWVESPKPSAVGTQRYPHASYPGLEATEAPGITSAAQAGTASVVDAEKAGGVRVVGESMPHLAAARHCTGEAEYADDAAVPPGTLHAWLVRANCAPATIDSIDATSARTAPGVKRIFFASDLAEGAHNSIGPIAKDEMCFAEGKVEHVGQVMGIVVAETAEQARIASTLIRVTYGPPPEGVAPVYTIKDAIAAQSFFDQAPFDSRHDLAAGPSVEDALAAPGLVVVEGEFQMGGQEHFYLECNTTLATPTDDGGLHLLASTQAVDKTQKMVARVCGLPCHKVVAKVKRMGGGFGGKETRSVFASCACAVAAHALNVPVRLSLRRDVDMGTSGGRHPFLARYRAAARIDEAGVPRLAALDVQMYSNGGAMLDLSTPVLDRALLHVDNVYKWPSFRARGVVCKTHTPPNTAFRGFGGPQGMLITEHIMEHLAAEMRMSSFDLRNANLYRDGDEAPFGQTLESGEWRIPRAWGELRKDADFDARQAGVVEFNRANRWRKRGLAMVPTKYGINFTAKFMNQGGALVHVYTDGSILISHGGTEMGQGLHTKVCQVAARAFAVPLSACHVVETATDKVANSQPTAASASTDLYAMATLDACRQILSRLRPLREKMPTATLAELALTAFFERIDLSAHGFFAIDTNRCGFDWNVRPGTKSDGTPDNTTRGHPFNYFTQGVGCVEVEVDVLTGDHEVNRADLLVDLGSSINPALDIGQIEGAFTQGMGWTTTEELMWGDSEHPWIQPPGRLHTAGPGAYKIPSFNDTPRQFNVRLMSGVDNKVAVHSSKAVGEPPFFLGAATFFAIRNAVASARADHLASAGAGGEYPHMSFFSPATSERIRMACGDRFAVGAIGDVATAQADVLLCKGSF